MKTSRRPVLVAALVTVAVGGWLAVVVGQQKPVASKPATADALLGAAQYQEQIEGKLEAAIGTYRKVLAAADATREQKARALLQLGQCQEKLGQAEARKSYERLVKDYGDQAGFLAQARTRLSALERAGDLSHPAGITLRKVWVHQDGIVDGSPSPDGRYLSFIDWHTGDLAVRDLGTGTDRRLTNKGSWTDSDEYADEPVISPDGKQIAFGWYNKEGFYELRIVGVDGSQPRVVFRDKEVADYVRPFQWTSDGKHLLTGLTKSGVEGMRIALIPAAGGPMSVLKALAHDTSSASLSPDGRFLVFEQPGPGKETERDIFLLAVHGGQEVSLVRHPADDFDPVWTPDGTRVLFVSDRTGSNGLWTIGVVEGKAQGSPELLKDGLERRIRPNGFTRLGSFIYSTETLSGDDVYIAEVNLAAGNVSRQPVPVPARFIGANLSPSWSPDGRRLAYYSRRTGGAFADEPTLVIHSIETDEDKAVPVKLDQLPYPVRWFPDGKSVLVSAWDSPKREQVAFYRVDTETGEHRLVRSSPGWPAARSELSPDGKTLYFFTGGEPKLRGGVIARDIATGQEREIARVQYLADTGYARLCMSPDGKYLAFRSPVDEHQWTALRLLPAAGGELRELIRFRQSEANASDELSWTPDGHDVLMVRNTGREGMPELWRIPIAGGEPQRTGLSMNYMCYLAVHPDGRRIAFDTSAGSYAWEVWVLENFLPGLRPAR